MILETGEKIHVITRRGFEAEVRRHFVGQVQATTESTVRCEGYAFVFNATRNEYSRRPERRDRVISLTDARNIINVLPRNADLEAVVYRLESNRLVVTDGKTFKLDINEFGANR